MFHFSFQMPFIPKSVWCWEVCKITSLWLNCSWNSSSSFRSISIWTSSAGFYVMQFAFEWAEIEKVKHHSNFVLSSPTAPMYLCPFLRVPVILIQVKVVWYTVGIQGSEKFGHDIIKSFKIESKITRLIVDDVGELSNHVNRMRRFSGGDLGRSSLIDSIHQLWSVIYRTIQSVGALFRPLDEHRVRSWIPMDWMLRKVFFRAGCETVHSKKKTLEGDLLNQWVTNFVTQLWKWISGA